LRAFDVKEEKDAKIDVGGADRMGGMGGMGGMGRMGGMGAG
jgi:hypothetical protein